MAFRVIVTAWLAVLLVAVIVAGQEKKPEPLPRMTCSGEVYQEKTLTGDSYTFFEIKKCASDKLGLVCEGDPTEIPGRKIRRLRCEAIRYPAKP